MLACVVVIYFDTFATHSTISSLVYEVYYEHLSGISSQDEPCVACASQCQLYSAIFCFTVDPLCSLLVISD